jgi:transcriptional regulator with XRE-family HTH domain
MDNNFNDKIQKLIINEPSEWKEKAKYRRSNQKWLRYSSEIARRIIAIIHNNKELTQVKLAEQLQVTPQYINKVLKGHENLTLETIAKISTVLGVELIAFPSYKYSSDMPAIFVGHTNTGETQEVDIKDLYFKTERVKGSVVSFSGS